MIAAPPNATICIIGFIMLFTFEDFDDRRRVVRRRRRVAISGSSHCCRADGHAFRILFGLVFLVPNAAFYSFPLNFSQVPM